MGALARVWLPPSCSPPELTEQLTDCMVGQCFTCLHCYNLTTDMQMANTGVTTRPRSRRFPMGE